MADAHTPPTSGSCPTCGAPVERGQLVCLTCGGRVGLQYERPPRWQVPVMLAAAVVALAVVGVLLALQAASDDAESEVARGPASREEARATTRAATQDKTQPDKESADSSLAVAKLGPVAVLSGVPEKGAAAEYARVLKRDGYKVGGVTNAPGGVGSFSVQYADSSEKAAKALAQEEGIGEVKAMEPAVADRAGGAKLVVIVGPKN